MRDDNLARILSIGQGLFYMITGFWPLFSRRSFEKVTGPKHDFWLVNTVGVIIGSVGLVLISAGYHRRVTPEIRCLAVGTAASLSGIDIFYVSKRRIPRIYLLDAAAEIGLITVWLIEYVTGQKR
jgi:hypothetical protein